MGVMDCCQGNQSWPLFLGKAQGLRPAIQGWCTCPTPASQPWPVSEKAAAIFAATSTFLAAEENTQSRMILRDTGSIDVPQARV